MTVWTLTEWAKAKLPGCAFWTGFAVTKHQPLWGLFHNWPDWGCQKAKLSRNSSSGLKKCRVDFSKQGTPESRHFQRTDSEWIAWAARAFHWTGVIQPIWGLYRTPGEISQPFSWERRKLEHSTSHVAMPSKSFSRVTRNNESRKHDKRLVTCYVCGILGHIARDCRKKESAIYNNWKRKGDLDKACQETVKKRLKWWNKLVSSIKLCCFWKFWKKQKRIFDRFW